MPIVQLKFTDFFPNDPAEAGSFLFESEFERASPPVKLMEALSECDPLFTKDLQPLFIGCPHEKGLRNSTATQVL